MHWNGISGYDELNDSVFTEEEIQLSVKNICGKAEEDRYCDDNGGFSYPDLERKDLAYGKIFICCKR